MSNTKILILGDNTEETSKLYQKLGLPPSKLITSVDQEYQVGHTSRQDFNSDIDFENVLSQADSVIWANRGCESFGTKEIYYDFLDWIKQYQYRHHNIKNFESIKFDPYHWKPQVKTVEKDDLIALGCSLTAGTGLTDLSQGWSAIVSNNLGLQNKNFGQPGGSLQKLFSIFNRLDFYQGQTVILQVPPLPRIKYVLENGTLQDVMLGRSNSSDQLLAVFNDRYLFYNAYEMILSMVKRCRSSNVKFVFFLFDYKTDYFYNHEDQMYFYDLPEFVPNLSIQNYKVDVGTDNLHPGPKSHEYLAEVITNHFNRLYT